MIESFVTYIRTLRFIGPEIEKRYFRIFGDLEYDLLALRIEITVMRQRLHEVKRRARACQWVSSEDERQISVTSHELNEHLYERLERLHKRITAAKDFRYDRDRERQAYYLFNDIAMAIMGLQDESRRRHELTTLNKASDAYARLDLNELLDLHDSVQQLLALERREDLEPTEQEKWKQSMADMFGRYPLRHAQAMETPQGIESRMARLKRRIDAEQGRLEMVGMVYTGTIRSMRFRN